MYLITENYQEKNQKIKNLNLCDLVKFVLDFENAPKDSCVSINFVDKDKIHSLNKQFRNIDKPTDVLSFECDGIDDEFSHKGNYDLGDIFICPEIAKANSIKFNNDFESEIKLLVVHGVLHLCGYDHIDDKEAEIMESKEDEILKEWYNN